VDLANERSDRSRITKPIFNTAQNSIGDIQTKVATLASTTVEVALSASLLEEIGYPDMRK